MDASFSPAELAFRDEVRAFIRENLPEDLAAHRIVDEHVDGNVQAVAAAGHTCQADVEHRPGRVRPHLSVFCTEKLLDILITFFRYPGNLGGQTFELFSTPFKNAL